MDDFEIAWTPAIELRSRILFTHMAECADCSQEVFNRLIDKLGGLESLEGYGFVGAVRIRMDGYAAVCKQKIIWRGPCLHKVVNL